MPASLARALLLALSTLTLAAGAWGFWTQSGVYPITHPALYACSLAPAAAAVIALVVMFVPFDSPASAPRWAAPLAGLALGVSAGGLVMYTATFVWLGPVLVTYAGLLLAAASGVARGARPRPAPPKPPPPPPAPAADTPTVADITPAEGATRKKRKKKDGGASSDTQPALPAGPPAPPEPAPAPPPPAAAPAPSQEPLPTRGRNVLLALAIGWGVALCFAWRPPAGATHPAPPDADVKSVLRSESPHIHERHIKRVLRKPDHIEITGNRIEVKVWLTQPRVEVLLRQQRFVIDPTLAVEEGTVDGFFSIPAINGYRAEAWGPADVLELAESDGRREGKSLGYVRLRYPDTRVQHDGSLAALLGPLGRPPKDALAARVDVGVRLETGEVTIDAITEVPRPLTVRRTVLGALHVPRAAGATLRLDLGRALELVPPEGRPGTSAVPAELLVTDGKVVRALKSRRRDVGPYETVDVGTFEGWFTLEGLTDRFLFVTPDWTAQASTAPSRTAGHGLPENALAYWREGEALNVVTDVAGTRVGPGRLSSELPAGVYRHRLRLLAIAPGDDPALRGPAARMDLLQVSRANE